MAGDAMVVDRLSAQKLRPKCSTPVHSATAIKRGHWPGAGRLRKAASISASKARRNPVNSSGGNSINASLAVMKLPAHASAISETRKRSRPPRRWRWSLGNLQPLVQLAQRPQRTDQQEQHVGEETWSATFHLVADELADPRHHEYGDGDDHQRLHAERIRDPTF